MFLSSKIRGRGGGRYAKLVQRCPRRERERNRRIAKEEGLRFFASASLYRVSLAIRNYAAQGPLTAKLRSWSFHGAIFYPGFIHRGESQRGEEER